MSMVCSWLAVRRSHTVAWCVSLLLVQLAAATTYEPLDFATLAQRAEHIVRGKVERISSNRVARGGQHWIESTVQIRLLAPTARAESETITLSLLGGQVGDEVMQVDAMPQFAPGEEVILFVAGNGKNVCPILGWSHGAFRVRVRPTGSYVARWNGEPLTEVADVVRSLDERRGSTATAADALTPEAFLAAAREARAGGRR